MIPLIKLQEVASRRPEAIALMGDAGFMTWREFADRAEIVASRLRITEEPEPHALQTREGAAQCLPSSATRIPVA